ncbi:MAG: phosphatase PAP2 family protein [Chitinophagaceae bacterium]
MFLLRLTLAAVVILAFQNNCFCQAGNGTDTAGLLYNKTAISKEINWDTAAIKKQSAIRMFYIPAVMIAYGVVSLTSDGLEDWNQGIKEEIWTERPHKQLHIDNYLQWAPAVAVYGLNLAGIKGKNNFRDRTIIYGMSTLMMSATVFGVKKLTGEWRPDGSNKLSFPSGHTATAFAAAEFLRKEYQDVSPWYGIAGYAVAAATGYLRMYNNKHWLGDVVAGAGIGILSTDLAYRLYPVMKRTFFKKEKLSSTMVMPFYNGTAAGLSLVHHF